MGARGALQAEGGGLDSDGAMNTFLPAALWPSVRQSFQQKCSSNISLGVIATGV